MKRSGPFSELPDSEDSKVAFLIPFPKKSAPTSPLPSRREISETSTKSCSIAHVVCAGFLLPTSFCSMHQPSMNHNEVGLTLSSKQTPLRSHETSSSRFWPFFCRAVIFRCSRSICAKELGKVNSWKQGHKSTSVLGLARAYILRGMQWTYALKPGDCDRPLATTLPMPTTLTVPLLILKPTDSCGQQTSMQERMMF